MNQFHEEDAFNAQFIKAIIDPQGVCSLDVKATIRDGEKYMPVWFRNISRALYQCLKINFSSYLFIDVGCGNGLALSYVSSHYSFKKLIGIEINRDLIEEALRLNLDNRFNIDFKIDNAMTYKVPVSPSFIFLFNPFGADTLKQFLNNNLSTMIENNCWLIYINDRHRDIIDKDFIIHRDEQYNFSVYSFGRGIKALD